MDSQKGKKPVKRATTKPARKANKPIQKNKIIPQNEKKVTAKALEEKEILFTNFNKYSCCTSTKRSYSLDKTRVPTSIQLQ
jgi:hypothetical protein